MKERGYGLLQKLQSDRADFLEKHSIETATKFMYFMVGLTFAILGLSVESTMEITRVTQISWFILVLAGFAGILRIEWYPSVLLGEILKLRKEILSSWLNKAKEVSNSPVGSKWLAEEESGMTLEKLNEVLKEYRSLKEKSGLDRKWYYKNWVQKTLYFTQIFGFPVGVTGLLVDRVIWLNF